MEKGSGAERLRPSNTGAHVAARNRDLLRKLQSQLPEELMRQPLFDARNGKVIEDAIENVVGRASFCVHGLTGSFWRRANLGESWSSLYMRPGDGLAFARR